MEDAVVILSHAHLERSVSKMFASPIVARIASWVKLVWEVNVYPKTPTLNVLLQHALWALCARMDSVSHKINTVKIPVNAKTMNFV